MNLEILLENKEEDLPFKTNVNEALVLEFIKENQNALDSQTISKIRQWIRFNKNINSYEDEPYHSWVGMIYANIETILNSAENVRR